MKKKMISILLLVLTAASLVCLTACSSGNSLDLNQYVTITINGYNGRATATPTFDEDAFIAENADKIKLSSAGAQMLEAGEEPIDLLSQLISGSLDQTSGLSNGDTIHLNWEVSSSSLDRLFVNLNLKYDTLSYHVSGLEELPEDAPEYLLYAGTEHYVTTLLELSSEDLSTLAQDGMDRFASLYVEPDTLYSWDERERTLDSIELVGYDFIGCTNDSYLAPSTRNQVCAVYQVTAIQHDVDEDGTPVDTSFCYYWYYLWENVKVAADGSICSKAVNYCTDRMTNSYSSNAYHRNYGYLEYCGRRTLEDVSEQLIQKKLDETYLWFDGCGADYYIYLESTFDSSMSNPLE